MAVHFCPALVVISRDELLDVEVELRAPVASGPRIEQLSESASAVNRTARRRSPGGLATDERLTPSR